jgi:ATP-dependent RNA helicase DHX36
LTDDRIKTIQNAIKTYQKISTDVSFRNQQQSSDFMETLKKSAAAPPKSCGETVDDELLDEFLEKSLLEEYVEMLESRQKLPAFQKKDEIVEIIKKHQVVLIEGNTGCGKTTQVAQYILDDALMKKIGSKTKILCTQPRRIAGEFYEFFKIFNGN